jgi:uncharacterized protein YjbJ (UPF0337 family)
MSAKEKVRAKVEQLVGRLAQAAGRAKGGRALTAKGHAAETVGRARGAKESVKDTGRRR